MSYKQPKKRTKRSKMFYPNLIKVDEKYNEETLKHDNILISTGPYRKDLCTDENGGVNVNNYLKHLIYLYNDRNTKK